MRFTALFALAILAGVPAACATPAPATPPPPPAPAPETPPPAQACTRIGCEDGWSIELAGATSALPATYTIRVLVDGAVVGSVQCTAAQPCGDHVFIAGVTAEEAELEIVGADVPLRWTVRPAYSVNQPNGPNCPPTCRQARVSVRLG